MQREIKFRGQRIDTKKWVYGYYYELDGTPYIIEKGTGFFTITNGEQVFGTAYIHEVIPETVGQYTGLKDKNGKEIYEGDKCFIGRPCVSVKGYIKYHQGCFIFEEFRTSNIIRLCDLKLNGYEIEIIGNIYDNPELLGGKL